MKIIRNLAGAFGIGLSVLAVAALSTPAFAQPNPLTPRSFAARIFPTQQTHYLRFPIAFNSCVYVANTCSFKVGSVPYNSFMVRAFTQTFTTYSGGGVTAMTVSFGTTATPTTELMAATTILTAGNAVAQTVAAGGLGVTVTGNGIAQTGTLGGFDIWARITATTGNPTAGVGVGIIEYIAPNDGACTQVGTGVTAVGC
jgi:hypothetical protein